MFFKTKVLLKIWQISQENTCTGVFFLLKTPTQVFSYEICEIFKNTFFYRIPPVAAFEILLKILREKNY